MFRRCHCHSWRLVLPCAFLALAAVLLWHRQSADGIIEQGPQDYGAVSASEKIAPPAASPPASPDSKTLAETSNSRAKMEKDPVLSLFKRKLQPEDLRKILGILDAVTRAVTQAGIPYIIYSGSLVGSWRHHGLIPWDDDVDLMMPANKMADIEKALTSLGAYYVLSKRQKVRWKVYAKGSFMIKNVGGVDWGWPFLDISFWAENATHLWDVDLKKFPNFIYPRSSVFPLSVRPFEGRCLPAPRDPKAFLTRTYPDVDTSCVSSNYDHRKEIFVSKDMMKKVLCQQLQGLVPFVVRQPTFLQAVNIPPLASSSSATPSCLSSSSPAMWTSSSSSSHNHSASEMPSESTPTAGNSLPTEGGASRLNDSSSSLASQTAATGCLEYVVIDSAVVACCFINRNPC